MDIEEFLNEIKLHLPIEDIEVSDYYERLSNTILINYNNKEYQFAYFGIHLLFMTYIYYIIWQASKFDVKKYDMLSSFARSFNGQELDFQQVKSLFEFKVVPEKNIINFLYLLDLDNGYIGNIKNQVSYRNEMAHAIGTYNIVDLQQFEYEIGKIINIIRTCSKKISNNLLLQKYVRQIYNELYLKSPKVHVDIFVDEKIIIEISASYEEIKFLYRVGKNKICNEFNKISASFEESNQLYFLHKEIKKVLAGNYTL